MNCIICGDKRPLIGQGTQGMEILLTPVVKVWCCDTCAKAIVLNAARKSFYEKFQKVKE